MDNLRLNQLNSSAVADRVVAWHNRHPLARRIGAAQVHAIGYVALPFTGEALSPAGLTATATATAIAIAAATAAPTAAQAAAQAIAAAAATPLPVLIEAAQSAAAETQNPVEGSRLRERALAPAREQAADPHGAPAADSAAAVLATLAPGTLKRDFSEDFIDTLSARQVARFALKFGLVLARPPLDAPVRKVRAGDGMPDGRKPERRQRVPAQVYLLTAVIETDTRKSRVLLGHGSAVLGQRIHSGPRIAALLAVAVGVMGTPLWWMQADEHTPAQTALQTALQPTPQPALQTTLQTALQTTLQTALQTAPQSAAAAGALLPPPASSPLFAPLPSLATPPSPVGSAASAVPSAVPSEVLPAVLPAAQAAAAAPVTVADSPMPVPMPVPMREPVVEAPVGPEARTRRRGVSIVPLLSEEQKALAREQRQARVDAAAAAAPAALPPSPVSVASAPVAVTAALTGAVMGAVTGAVTGAKAPLAPPVAAFPARAPPVQAAPSGAPAFAISTRTLRTRAEADQVRVAMQALLQTLGHARVQVDVLSQGEDWRVVALPFPQRADAEKGRAMLASRGMRAEVVDF